MDRETAESYVQYGIKSTKFTKKMCMAFLPLNIISSMIAIAAFHEINFVILVVIFIIINIVTSLLFKAKWSVISGLLSQATQASLFAIAIDFIYFSLFQMFNLFVWYEFLISIITQIVALCVSIPIVIILAKKHKKDKTKDFQVPAKIVASIAACACSSATLFCKIFLKDAPLSFVWVIMSSIFNLMVYLLCYIIVRSYYRVYLIKKYKLEIDLN